MKIAIMKIDGKINKFKKNFDSIPIQKKDK